MAQLVSFDIDSETEQQLTRHPRDIVAFDLSGDVQTILFASPTPPDWTVRNERGFVVDANTMRFVKSDDAQSAADTNIRLFVANRRTGQTAEIATDLVAAHPVDSSSITISPDGRWAVIAVWRKSLPRRWRAYRGYVIDRAFSDSEMTIKHPAATSGPSVLDSGLGQVEEDEDALSRQSQVGQYWIVDLASGSAKPLLDAPTAESYGARKAVWSQDSRHVLLPKSYLPLDTTDIAELGRRQSQQALVEIVLPSSRFRRIADAPDFLDSDLTSVEWKDDQTVLASYRDRDGAQRSLGFSRRDNQWSPDRQSSRDSDVRPRVRLRVAQSLNVPPRSKRSTPTPGIRLSSQA